MILSEAVKEYKIIIPDGLLDTQLVNLRSWINELKTTDKPQARGYLWVTEIIGTTGVGFCCLGIACEMVKKVLRLDWSDKDSITPSFAGSRYDLTDDSIRNYFGFSVVGGFRVEITSQQGQDFKSLTHLNDTVGLTFKEIADIVEYYLNEKYPE